MKAGVPCWRCGGSILDTCIQCGAERDPPIAAEDFEQATGISPDPKHRMGHYVKARRGKKLV